MQISGNLMITYSWFFSRKGNANTNRRGTSLKLIFLKYNRQNNAVTNHIQIFDSKEDYVSHSLFKDLVKEEGPQSRSD